MRLWSRFALWLDSVDRELRRSGPSVRLNAHATASESTGIIGSLVFGRSESSLPIQIIHPWVLHVLTLLLLLLPLLLLSALLLFHVLLVLLVLCTRVALCHPCMLHIHIIRGRSQVEEEVFRSGRRFASCLRGGGRGKFSAGRRCSGAGCRFHFQEATRHRYQACQGKCGHAFPPPGGSWYPIRVTWIRIGHQAIDGLDEGV